MLSVVEVRPSVPQPRVKEGVSALPRPMQPCAPGPLTRIRLTGICRAKDNGSRWLRVWMTAV